MNTVFGNIVNYLLSSRFDYNHKTITFIDIDDCVFKTSANVWVKDIETDEDLYSLTPSEFNHHKLKDDERYDFREFRSSEVFRNSIEPIDRTVFQIQKILRTERFNRGIDKVVFVTARSNMDNKELFLKCFRELGLPMDNQDFVRIERAGNIQEKEGLPVPEAKYKIMKSYLDKDNYMVAKMIDDSTANLDAFMELQLEYPRTRFISIVVNEDGTISRYK